MSRWRWVLIALAVGYIGAVLVVPIAALVREALSAGPSVLIAALAAPGALRGLWLSLALAGAAVLVNGVLGIAGGIVLTRHRFRGKQILNALVDLTLSVSPVMIGLAILLVFGRSGVLEPVMRSLGVQVAFAFPGLLLCTLFVTLPFTIREVAYVLEELGTDEEEVASTLGASGWQTFWRVTLPNVSHALRLGLTLTAARALGEFGAVLVVGGAIAGQTETATTFISNAMEERQEPAALAMALVLASASILLLAVLEQLKKRSVVS